jgi:hypothetical protein
MRMKARNSCRLTTVLRMRRNFKSEEKREVGEANKEWEPRLVVLRTPAAYACMNVRRNGMDEVTTGDHKRAHIEEEVLDISLSASNIENQGTWKR